MPLYEYRCSQCSERMEILAMTYDDPPGLSCRNCGSGNLRRLISRVGPARMGSAVSQNDLATIDRDVKRRFEKRIRDDTLLG